MREKLMFEPGTKVSLKDWGTKNVFSLRRQSVEAKEEALFHEMKELQELLYAAGRHSVLIILQGMDTSGKDGTIKNVMDPVNPIGVRVTGFKVPTEIELEHDFLWRVHAATPRKGMIGIFNRSHYEDVLVVRVHDLVPPSVWRRRFRHINDFERLLVDSNTIVMKFFLHISKEEQRERLIEREHEVEKAWKLSSGDWREREHWEGYEAAYEEALSKTNTSYARWHIVPADKKWARNHFILSSIVDTLKPFRDQWLEYLADMGAAAKAELEAYRAKLAEKGST